MTVIDVPGFAREFGIQVLDGGSCITAKSSSATAAPSSTNARNSANLHSATKAAAEPLAEPPPPPLRANSNSNSAEKARQWPLDPTDPTTSTVGANPRPLAELITRQLEFANVVVLNKTDLLGEVGTGEAGPLYCIPGSMRISTQDMLLNQPGGCESSESHADHILSGAPAAEQKTSITGLALPPVLAAVHSTVSSLAPQAKVTFLQTFVSANLLLIV